MLSGISERQLFCPLLDCLLIKSSCNLKKRFEVRLHAVIDYKGSYWDRLGESDYDVTDSPELLLALFERKNPHLFEDREVIGMTMADIDSERLLLVER